MSTDAYPLHVKAGIALGFTDVTESDGKWWGKEPGGLRIVIPRYDSSWCSTGPLTERFKISVSWEYGQWIAHHMTSEGHDQYQGGDRPTQAIAKLVVHLSKEGKLKE